METTETTTLTEKVISGLRTAADELEKFRLQAALGKAEARDLFEDVKKKLKKSVHDAQVEFEKIKGMAGEKWNSLQPHIENLKQQLAAGKAETKEQFEGQRKKIVKLIGELEEVMKKNEVSGKIYIKLQSELHKLKIKLKILQLRYQVEELNASEKISAKKKEFTDTLTSIKDRLAAKAARNGDGTKHFRKEMQKAYSHLKSAFAG